MSKLLCFYLLFFVSFLGQLIQIGNPLDGNPRIRLRLDVVKLFFVVDVDVVAYGGREALDDGS